MRFIVKRAKCAVLFDVVFHLLGVLRSPIWKKCAFVIDTGTFY